MAADRPKSKPLRKAETSVARLTQKVLGQGHVFGVDLDFITRTKDGWAVIEFLKCESTKATPATSHPSRYWYNWRKFRTLWEIAKGLGGKLYLVNYEETEPSQFGRFRIMKANMSVKPDERTVIRTIDIEPAGCDLEQFKQWYLGLKEEAPEL